MSDPFVDLQTMIDKLHELESLPENAAPAAAEALRKRTQYTIDAGMTPYGEPWLLVRSGPREGQKALRNALPKVFITTIGPKIFMRVRGIEGRHNNGAVKGKVRRRIIPDKRGLSRRMSEDIRTALEQSFQRTMQSGGST